MESVHLPSLNAVLNFSSALFLSTGFLFIRKKNVAAHKICMVSAFVCSALFLCSYLYYHVHHGATPFAREGLIRIFYFVILVSHSVLAAAVVPLALATLIQALRGRFRRHAKIARWTWPVWMYVSVTGVVVYWMLYKMP